MFGLIAGSDIQRIPSAGTPLSVSISTPLTIGDPVTWYRVVRGQIDELSFGEFTN